MNLDALWDNLENADNRSDINDGVTVRRIDPASTEGLFAGVRQPAGTRLLLLRIASPPTPSEGQLIQTRGFLTSVNRFSGDSGHFHLFIESVGSSFNEVFGHVAGDVAEYVFSKSVSSSASSSFLERLGRWKRFFENSGGVGLSEIAAQGLLAELLFLRDFSIAESGSPETAVSSWAVPQPLSKDFQYMRGAIEVKCSVSREHTRVHIHGERQLDDSGIAALYLLAVLLERVTTTGFSLPETVNSIREILGAGSARIIFEEKLLDYGYLDAHAARYDQRYLLHRLRAFQVRDGFPRVPAVLPDGVGDLNYTIALSACTEFEIDPEHLRSVIKGVVHHDS